ncbi:MAG: DegT/DnrJ/EryC1/StrS family aminotransferase [Chthonomonadales bacterium]
MRVPLADLVQQYYSIEEEVNAAVRSVMTSAQFILGPTVIKLEEDIAEYSGAKYGVGVNSGTDAILLALIANDIGVGDEVITSPFTFVATVEAIALIGATPVFADIDPATFNLCSKNVEAKITSRTKAIMPVDLFGQMAPRDEFVALAEKHGLEIIWDAAQAIGASYNGKRLGEWPGTSTLSFFPTKNLGGAGDGGMILTNSETIRDRLIQIRFHGSGGGYVYARVGYCSRLDALQAGILGVKLPHLDAWNNGRRVNAERYLAGINSKYVVLPCTDPKAHHIYHQFTIRTKHRAELMVHLKSNLIDSGIYYPLALHLQEAYKYLGCKAGDYPHSEQAAAEVLSIPIHPGLTTEQINHVITQINAFAP